MISRKINRILVINNLLFLSFAEIFVCELENLPQRRLYYYKLYKVINYRICDEASLDGRLFYDNLTLDQFNECDKLEAKMKVK